MGGIIASIPHMPRVLIASMTTLGLRDSYLHVRRSQRLKYRAMIFKAKGPQSPKIVPPASTARTMPKQCCPRLLVHEPLGVVAVDGCQCGIQPHAIAGTTPNIMTNVIPGNAILLFMFGQQQACLRPVRFFAETNSQREGSNSPVGPIVRQAHSSASSAIRTTLRYG